MKKKIAIILLIISFIVGSVAGFFGGVGFMNHYILEISSLGTAGEITRLHNALRSADSGNLTETQKKLETYLKFALATLDLNSDFTSCPSAEKSVQKTKLYLKERKENKITPNK